MSVATYPGHTAVTRTPLVPQVLTHGVAQGDNGELAHGIARPGPGRHPLAGQRRQVDDPAAAAGLEVRQAQARERERAFDVDLPKLIQCLFGGFINSGDAQDAGGIDEAVKPAETGACLCDPGFGRVLVLRLIGAAVHALFIEPVRWPIATHPGPVHQG